MAEVMNECRLKCRLEMCINVLNKYSWLLDSYVLVKLVHILWFFIHILILILAYLILTEKSVPKESDFFTENHMKKLPTSWFAHIKSISLEKFDYLIDLSSETKNVWPLSIICLRVLIKFLQVPRQLCVSDNVSLVESNKIDNSRLFELINIKSACFEHPKLRNYFLKHVKPKKQYEIYKIAVATAETAKKLDVKHVIDVGSGLGHLSRLLAYGFDLQVCSIETQIQLTAQALEMDCQFEKIASKYLSELEFQNVKNKRPVHLNQTIKFDLSAENFIKNVKEAFSLSGKNMTFGIVGLHPCGDLAAVLLKLYVDCSEAKFINLVGCCYHKLSTSSDSKHDVGFPLTDFCTQKCRNISYEARALACHAIEAYRDRLISKNYDHLKIHCYRAALENLINKNWPQHKKSALGNVKSTPGLTFSQYCKTALKKLNLNLTEEDLESEETVRNLSEWQDVVKFYSLRLMLAPLIESVILLDRKIFLLERGFQCNIKATFDPDISPRNQLLVSQKTI